MFSLNISCPICKVVFQNEDTMYSTSCGHIFHYSCLNQWRSKSSSCSVCRVFDPTWHPIYVNFENGVEYESVVNNLNGKIQSYEAKNKQLQEALEKNAKDKDSVKRLYKISEQWRAELEHKIQTLQQQQEEMNAEQAIVLTEKSEEVEMLKTHIEILEKNNVVEELNKKYKESISENVALKKKLEESETLKIELDQRIKMQEQRLRHLTLELTKQFDESFKKVNQPESENRPENAQAASPKKRSSRRPKKIGQNGKSALAKNVSMESLISGTLASVRSASKESKSFELTQPNDRRVMILDFPRENLVLPLKDTIILLASKMAITLTYSDIVNVDVVPPKKKDFVFDKVFLVVEFVNIEMKIQFLKFTNRLKFDAQTKTIKVKEFVDKQSYETFMYANKKLRGNGYEYIACKDNKVIAKKKLHDTEEIVIYDQSYVDTLLRSQTRPLTNILNNSLLLDPFDGIFF